MITIIQSYIFLPVCASRNSHHAEAIYPHSKSYLLQLDDTTCRELSDTVSNNTSSRIKEVLYKSVEQKLDREVGFTCGGIETLNKRDSGVLVVHM